MVIAGPKTYVAAYTRRDIEELMPAIWDESYAYGMPEKQEAPEQDMPKAAASVAHRNSHWAYIADIKTGWAMADLTQKERCALVLFYGTGWKQSDIAFNQGCTQQAISPRLENAVGKIMR